MHQVTGEWSLVELEGIDLEALGPAHQPSLTIGNDGAVRGFSGVNRFSATIDAERLQRGELATGPALSTRMAGPPEAMDAEQRLLGVLEAGSPCTVEGTDLVLRSNDGNLRARFTR